MTPYVTSATGCPSQGFRYFSIIRTLPNIQKFHGPPLNARFIIWGPLFVKLHQNNLGTAENKFKFPPKKQNIIIITIIIIDDKQ
jgi:hypothetical protein